MTEFKNFYELFELNPNTSQEEIRRVTKEKLRNSHPDRTSDDDGVTPAQFETIKIAREVLTDEEEKEKYDTLGHNRYVNNHIDNPIEGHTFTGDSSLSASDDGDVLGSRKDGDLDELVSFNKKDSMMDPTKGAVSQDEEGGISANKAQKQKESTVEATKQVKEDGEGSQAAGLLVSIGAIITNDYLQLGFILAILLGVYYGVYIFFGGLGVPFAMGFSIGLFYFPVFRKIFTEPFE